MPWSRSARSGPTTSTSRSTSGPSRASPSGARFSSGTTSPRQTLPSRSRSAPSPDETCGMGRSQERSASPATWGSSSCIAAARASTFSSSRPGGTTTSFGSRSGPRTETERSSSDRGRSRGRTAHLLRLGARGCLARAAGVELLPPLRSRRGREAGLSAGLVRRSRLRPGVVASAPKGGARVARVHALNSPRGAMALELYMVGVIVEDMRSALRAV